MGGTVFRPLQVASKELGIKPEVAETRHKCPGGDVGEGFWVARAVENFHNAHCNCQASLLVVAKEDLAEAQRDEVRGGSLDEGPKDVVQGDMRPICGPLVFGLG